MNKNTLHGGKVQSENDTLRRHRFDFTQEQISTSFGKLTTNFFLFPIYRCYEAYRGNFPVKTLRVNYQVWWGPADDVYTQHTSVREVADSSSCNHFTNPSPKSNILEVLRNNLGRMHTKTSISDANRRISHQRQDTEREPTSYGNFRKYIFEGLFFITYWPLPAI